jgi:hypothetical protein
MRLKLQYGKLLSSLGLKSNLRRYNLDTDLSIPSSLFLFTLNRVVDLGFFVSPLNPEPYNSNPIT